MPDIWLDVDTAVTVPVNLMPLIDDTDFKSIEINVAYNATGLALTWHFITTAGVITATAVTPTDGTGVYDWSEDLADKGTYKIEIPASGGGTINNDTEGYGWFTGVATGVLPWRSPVIGFRAAGINNVLVDSAYSATRGLAGTALPDAAADAAGGIPVSDAGGLDVDTILDRVTANVALASVCTETRLAELDAANLITDVANVKSDTAAILADTGTDGVVVAAASKTGYSLAADQAVNVTKIAGAAVDVASVQVGVNVVNWKGAAAAAMTGDAYARLGAPAGASVSADVAAVKADTAATLADTGTDGVVVAAASKTGYALSSAGVNAVADQVWDETLSEHATAGSTGAGLGTAGGGTGATSWTYTITDSSSGLPIADVDVWATTDAAGASIVARGTTNAAGVVSFMLTAGTYYVWRYKSGYTFSNPDTEVVS